MSIFIAKGAQINFNNSLEKPVNPDIIKSASINKRTIEELEAYNKPIFSWAWKSKKSNGAENHKEYREQMKKDDTILFVSTGRKTESEHSQTIMYAGKVICTDKNSKFAQLVWGVEYKELFDFIIFIKDIKRIEGKIYLEDFMQKVRNNNCKFHCPNAYKLKELEEENAYKYFGNMIGLSLIDYITNENQKLEDKNLEISKIESFIDKSFELDVNEKNYKRSTKKSINTDESSKKTNIKKKQQDISEYNKNLIGYIGEKSVFNLLKLRNEKIYNILDIKNTSKVTWFNENQDVRDKNYSDQSVGQGCDIYITDGNEEILLEIKSSYEEMNLLNFTHNEINTMKKCNTSNKFYYVVIVDRLKNIIKNKSPRVTVVKNFSQDINEDYIDISNTHIIYANKLVQKYMLSSNPSHKYI